MHLVKKESGTQVSVCREVANLREEEEEVVGLAQVAAMVNWLINTYDLHKPFAIIL